jgi:hypothetical protein
VFVLCIGPHHANCNSTVNDDDKAKMQGMFASMMAKYPEWKGQISPEESIGRMLDVVEKTGWSRVGGF